MKPIHIYGAGISGLVAAINLAREGYDVTVFEKEDRIGGSKKCTPSVHMTPFHFQKMREYIGIDVEPCFSSLRLFKAYIYNKIVFFNPNKLYVTERGPNRSSLDYYLYQRALEEGVNFEFSHPLTADMISKIPERSIIATGGYSLLCKDLKVYHVPIVHYDSYMKINDNKDYCIAYFDSYLIGYGYIAAKNGLLSAQVGFTLKQPYKKLIEVFKKQLKETEGLEFKKWSLVHDTFPGKTYLLKKIHGKTFILSGMISGFLDPFFGFGVNSAMISGKIAAMTVISKKDGFREFKKFTDKLNRMFLLSRVYDFLPFRNIIIPMFFNKDNKSLPVITGNLQNIPGFVEENCFEIQDIQDR